MTQTVRNKIYGVASAIIPVAVILGFITSDQATQALNFTDDGLTIALLAFTWGSNVLAFFKSLPSKVTVIDVPKADVDIVTKTDGTEITP